mmetsp:Transcript_22773/g.38537  ORF Transcript_22773/g.38537 Transcript_22773/m.38537 type:complete len:109 (+) Transcript_22773:1628-1954(+)
MPARTWMVQTKKEGNVDIEENATAKETNVKSSGGEEQVEETGGKANPKAALGRGFSFISYGPGSEDHADEKEGVNVKGSLPFIPSESEVDSEFDAEEMSHFGEHTKKK